eukprot:scaffold1154_cov200-Cylindrotheca_fusiformis.AAC.7
MDRIASAKIEVVFDPHANNPSAHEFLNRNYSTATIEDVLRFFKDPSNPSTDEILDDGSLFELIRRIVASELVAPFAAKKTMDKNHIDKVKESHCYHQRYMSNHPHTVPASHELLEVVGAFETELSDLDWTPADDASVDEDQQRQLVERARQIEDAQERLAKTERELTRLCKKTKDTERRWRKIYHDELQPRPGKCYSWTAETDYGYQEIIQISFCLQTDDRQERKLRPGSTFSIPSQTPEGICAFCKRQTSRSNRGSTDRATMEMDGKVFQTYKERSGADQFDDTKEKLEEYTAKYIKGEEGKDKVRAMVRDLKDPARKEPDPEDKTKPLDMYRYKDEAKAFFADQRRYRQGCVALYGVIWGQCSPQMQSRLEERADFKKEVVRKSNPLKLLLAIGEISHRFESHRQ